MAGPLACAEATRRSIEVRSGPQIREKLQSDGYSNIQIVRQGRIIEALGSKDGQTGKVLVDAQTGRLAGDGDDDD